MYTHMCYFFNATEKVSACIPKRDLNVCSVGNGATDEYIYILAALCAAGLRPKKMTFIDSAEHVLKFIKSKGPSLESALLKDMGFRMGEKGVKEIEKLKCILGNLKRDYICSDVTALKEKHKNDAIYSFNLFSKSTLDPMAKVTALSAILNPNGFMIINNFRSVENGTFKEDVKKHGLYVFNSDQHGILEYNYHTLIKKA